MLTCVIAFVRPLLGSSTAVKESPAMLRLVPYRTKNLGSEQYPQNGNLLICSTLEVGELTSQYISRLRIVTKIKKIPGKAGCLEKFTVEKFVHCIRKTMKISLENANVSCKVPALHFTDYNSSHLDYCPTREEALGRGLISECSFCNCAFCKISIFLKNIHPWQQ